MLIHDGVAVHVRFSGKGHLVDAVVSPELKEGAPFSFGVAPGEAHCMSSSVAKKLNELLVGTSQVSNKVGHRPTRTALTHLSAIQALDGALHGASHREIAIALFGLCAVQRDWSADGDLRARVRYLIRRGQQLSPPVTANWRVSKRQSREAVLGSESHRERIPQDY
jgi:hypothetical protein